jgi:hypothetical protein
LPAPREFDAEAQVAQDMASTKVHREMAYIEDAVHNLVGRVYPKACAPHLGSTNLTRPVLVIFLANNGARQNQGSYANAQHGTSVF